MENISKQFDLPATNDAINSNFNNLELHFICEETNLTFYFKEIKYIDDEIMVMSGTFYRETGNDYYDGYVEYCINQKIEVDKSFWCVNFYGQGTIKRLYPLTLADDENKEIAYNFLGFISQNLKDVKTTYESLDVCFEMQKKLITQGKMERPQIIYGFTPEDRKEFDEGLTFEELWDRVEKKLGKIEYD